MSLFSGSIKISTRPLKRPIFDVEIRTRPYCIFSHPLGFRDRWGLNKKEKIRRVYPSDEEPMNEIMEGLWCQVGNELLMNKSLWGFWTPFPICGGVEIPHISNIRTPAGHYLPGDRVRFDILRVESYETAPAHLYRWQWQAQVINCASDQLIID